MLDVDFKQAKFELDKNCDKFFSASADLKKEKNEIDVRDERELWPCALLVIVTNNGGVL